ncbi:MAG: hypothetical protein KAS69_00100 [Planctomycetes bacterium]|nr:hypothetical protein [Planctomycetota bacterium]
MKLRIAAAIAIGAVVLGILGWPLANCPPLGVVSLATGQIGLISAIILLATAFLTGLAAYFICLPFGSEIGVIAVPAGLAVWSIRSANMDALIRQNSALAQRQEIFTTLSFEPLFWLAVVAAGFAGVFIGGKIQRKTNTEIENKKSSANPSALLWTGKNIYLNAAIAVIVSAVIAQLCIGFLALDTKIIDSQIGVISTQPAVGQIAFAVLVAFGLAGFVVKKFLKSGYISPTIATAALTAVAISTHLKGDILQRLVEHYPPQFFSSAVLSILPVQMVSFGTLGAIIGYWLAVRYDWWQENICQK